MQVFKVAKKTYRNERSRDEFESELQNLDYLKESLGGGRHRIMLHLCSLVHGEDNFMILLPLAALRDLDIFLRGGYFPLANTRDQQQVYDFENTFPGLTIPVLHAALFKEMREIAAALVWLHQELQILGSSDRYCAHMDLKPENILLTPDRGSAVGKWWISDFGISIFNRNNNNQDSQIYSIRDFGRRITSRANQNEPNRAHGMYQPPEIDEDSIDPQKCDIWSFGGVLFDVLAFAVGRKTEVENVRSARFNGTDDYFYEPMPLLLSAPTTVNDTNTRIKRRVSSWLDNIQRGQEYPWIRNCVDILKKILVITPASRPSAVILLNHLNRLNLVIPRAEDPSSESPTSDPRVSCIEKRKSSSAQRPKLPPSTVYDFIHPISPPKPVTTIGANDSQVDPNLHLPDQHNQHTHQPSNNPLKMTTLHLPKDSKIISVAIAVTGNQVAFLSKHLIYFYPQIEPQAQTPIELSEGVTWQKICLGGGRLAMYGIKTSGQKAVSASTHGFILHV